MAPTVAILDFRSDWFQLFLIYKSPWCFLPSFKSIGLTVQEMKRKTDFLIGTISAVFDLQVTPMLPTKFQVNWPFGSGEAKKKKK